MRADNILVSIVIPCFNEKKYIKEIIDRVENVTQFTKEIIIIDDCSNDGTREILKKELEAKVDKVIYHDKIWGKALP